MNNKLQKDIERYIKDINLHLLCSRSEKKKIISDLKETVFDYAESNNIENAQQIFDHFGSVQYVAESFNKTFNSNTVAKSINFKRATIASFLALVAVVTVFFSALFADSHQINKGYYDVEAAEYIDVDSAQI